MKGVAVGVVEPVDGYGILCAGGIGVAVEVLRISLLACGSARSRVWRGDLTPYTPTKEASGPRRLVRVEVALVEMSLVAGRMRAELALVAARRRVEMYIVRWERVTGLGVEDANAGSWMIKSLVFLGGGVEGVVGYIWVSFGGVMD